MAAGCAASSLMTCKSGDRSSWKSQQELTRKITAEGWKVRHVKVDGGFESEGLFAPVWVTGQINTAMSTQSVSFNDGALDVEAGYRIEARDVVPYE